MPIIHLTGTTNSRMDEIQSNWFIAEPGSDLRLLQYPLYTVPVGQTNAASVVVNTGSLNLVSGVVRIEKDIHVFENEREAEKFVAQIGMENVASISERYGIRDDFSSYRIVEVQLVSNLNSKVEFQLLDCFLQRGFKLEIFSSSSLGLKEVEKEAIFNARGDLISDTYLKYFEIEEDS